MGKRHETGISQKKHKYTYKKMPNCNSIRLIQIKTKTRFISIELAKLRHLRTSNARKDVDQWEPLDMWILLNRRVEIVGYYFVKMNICIL